ncbi:MAG: TolC family protein [Ignavibacteriaceae bacterium]|jgi:outer membrane protein TolC
MQSLFSRKGTRIFILFIPILLYTNILFASQTDTVRISFTQAVRIFSQNNLQLLAARYNIKSAKAAILQAKLWSNPNISIGQNVYNKSTGRYFDFTKTGNTDIQIQQLFLLAGKRDKQIRLAKINTQIAEYTFYDLLRALKYELSTDFYNLFFLQRSLKFYNETIPEVKKTVVSSENLYTNRSILLSEMVRLKSLLFSLESDRLEIVNNISKTENDLQVLLRDSTSLNSYFIPEINIQSLDSLSLDNVSLKDILEKAVENRPDLQKASANVKYDEENVALQKALAVPDVTLGGNYSRNGSYIPDYFGVNVSIDIPIFNRNQGNIQISRINLDADKVNREQTRLQLEREITSAYQNAKQTDRLYKSVDDKFTGEYKQLVKDMISNYEKRDMTLIEFTDFFDSYRSTMLQVNQLQNNLVDAFEELNYAAGTNLFNQ